MAYPKLTPIVAAGATEPRYIGDRFADIVNVKDYGARGDGVTNDTEAFNLAIASGSNVFIPAGKYKLTEDILGPVFSVDKVDFVGGKVNGLSFFKGADETSALIDNPTFRFFNGKSIPLGCVMSNGTSDSTPCWDRVAQSFAIDPYDNVIYLTSNVASTGASAIYAFHWDEEVQENRTIIARSNWQFQCFAHQGLGLYRKKPSDAPKFFSGGNQYVDSLTNVNPDRLYELNLLSWDYSVGGDAVIEKTWTIFKDSEFDAVVSTVCVSPDMKWLAAESKKTSTGKIVIRVWDIEKLLSLSGTDATEAYSYSIDTSLTSVGQSLAVYDDHVYYLASSDFHFITCYDFWGNEFKRTPTSESQEIDTLPSVAGADTAHEGEWLNFVRIRGKLSLVLMVGLLTYPESADNYCRRQFFYNLSCGCVSSNDSLVHYAQSFGPQNPDTNTEPGLHFATSGSFSELGLFAGAGYFLNIRSYSTTASIVQFIFRGNFSGQCFTRIGVFTSGDGSSVSWGPIVPVTTAALSKGETNLDSLVQSGVYNVAGSGINIPSGSNGTVVTYGGEGGYYRQVFFRFGSANGNDFNIFTRRGATNNDTTTYPYGVYWADWVRIVTSKNPIFSSSPQPETTNTISCGTNDKRWTDVYITTGAIGGSDERMKDNILNPSEELMRAWGKVNIKIYQFKDAIEKKGETARLHVGMIAQQIEEAFASEGLDARRYGLLCYDEWEDKYDEGIKIREAGNMYSLRYTEALALECAYQRWRLEQLEERVNQLTNNSNK